MSFTVFLGNLPTWVTADDVKGWLQAENLVADAIKVIRNPETQESKGFAFIEAPNTEEMNAIIRRFDRAPLEDRLLRANPAQPPKPAEGKPAEAEASAAAPALAPEVIHRRVDESKPALQGCVDEALKREPALGVTGRIHIYATIAPSGAVNGARIDKKNVDQSPLGSCLKGATRRIQFPSFSGDAFEVDIPILVTSGE